MTAYKPPGPATNFTATLDGLTPETVCTGHLLIRQGDASDFALYVREGSVQVIAESEFGRVPIADIDAPRLIGEIGVLADLPRTATIEATTPVVYYRLSKKQMMSVGREDPSFFLSVISQLGQQVDGVNKAIGLFGNALAALEEDEFDPRILETLASPSPQLAALSSAFRRFADQIVAKRRQREELASAALIQRSFLPRDDAVTAISGLVDLHAHMRPARDVGGDFYDCFQLDEDRIVIGIGDVCGKGIPASLFMAVAITTLRNLAKEDLGLADTLAHANAILCRDNDAMMFATLFYGVLDSRSGVLEYCNCGHNAPLIVGGSGMRNLPATGIPLGMMAEHNPRAKQVTLLPDETLVMFTDGVTEAMDEDQNEFGDERLQLFLRTTGEGPSAQIVSRLFAEVDQFSGNADQADDITCVVLKRRQTG